MRVAGDGHLPSGKGGCPIPIEMSGLGARPSIDLPPKTHVGIKQLGRLQLNLLGHFEGIIDFNAEVPDSALQLGMPKKQLYRP